MLAVIKCEYENKAPVLPVEADFNSSSLIPWNKVKEGNTIRYEENNYEVAFKVVRKRAVDGYLIESNQILYLRPVSQGENVICEIDENNHFSLVWNAHMRDSRWNEESPSTGLGYESWTEEHLDSLKKELNEKIEKIRSLL